MPDQIKIFFPTEPVEIKRLLAPWLQQRGRPQDENTIFLEHISTRVKPEPCSRSSVASYLNGKMTQETLLPARIRTAIIEVVKERGDILAVLFNKQNRAVRARRVKKKG